MRLSALHFQTPPGSSQLYSCSSWFFKFSPRRAPSASLGRALFNFDDVSKYIIPASPLCGRLVVCNARQSKIIGFPSELSGNYERNYFRFNVCFVFDGARSAELAPYEAVVRKVGRVLASCEVRLI